MEHQPKICASVLGGGDVGTTDIYKGFSFADVSSQVDDGRYRAKVAIMGLEGVRTRSQRFLDLETFATEAEASVRALSGARAWIDENLGRDQLSLPTNFGPFD